MARLTPEVQNDIVAFLRAGGTPETAAEAAGVPARQFERWLRTGAGPKARRGLREFVKAVDQARAQARLAAEVATHGKRPLDWLKSGPGRAGWGPHAEPPAPPGLEHPAFRDLLADLVAALEPFPEAREAVAKVLGG